MNENRFYVYVLLDPRKTGNYTYSDMCFYYEPFYVGKGSGRRLNKHLTPSKSETTSFYRRKIDKIFQAGLTPIGIKLEKFEIEKEALDCEVKMIASIGRICEKTGPLTNLTSGGDSPVMSAETRAKISASNKGRSSPLKGMHLEDKSKLKISINNARYWAGKQPSPEKILKEKTTKASRKYKMNKCKYKAISPTGDEYIIEDTMERFCKEHGLTRTKMISLSSGKIKAYRGWQCQKIDDKKSQRHKTFILGNMVTGEIATTNNIIEFAKKRNLSSKRLYEVARNVRYCHKQWTCKEVI